MVGESGWPSGRGREPRRPCVGPAPGPSRWRRGTAASRPRAAARGPPCRRRAGSPSAGRRACRCRASACSRLGRARPPCAWWSCPTTRPPRWPARDPSGCRCLPRTGRAVRLSPPGSCCRGTPRIPGRSSRGQCRTSGRRRQPVWSDRWLPPPPWWWREACLSAYRDECALYMYPSRTTVGATV